MVNDLWWSEDPTGPICGGFTAVKVPILTAGLWVKALLLFPLLKWAIKAWREHGRGLLNGHVNLQLPATKTEYRSAKIMPYLRSSAGLETASRFLVTAPIASKFRLPSQLTSGKHLTAPAKAAGTLRLGPSKKAPKSQNPTTFTKRFMGGS